MKAPRLDVTSSPRASIIVANESLADMDQYFGTRYPTRAQSARLVDTIALLAIAMIGFSALAGWREGPFFTLWGFGWTIVWWALLPED
jgi:hypothetical protein